jgi:hypothetical protein
MGIGGNCGEMEEWEGGKNGGCVRRSGAKILTFFREFMDLFFRGFVGRDG